MLDDLLRFGFQTGWVIPLCHCLSMIFPENRHFRIMLEAWLAKFAAAVLVAEAGDQMVVDHAGGLHEGVDDGRADEFEAARAELL